MRILELLNEITSRKKRRECHSSDVKMSAALIQWNKLDKRHWKDETRIVFFFFTRFRLREMILQMI